MVNLRCRERGDGGVWYGRGAVLAADERLRDHGRQRLPAVTNLRCRVRRVRVGGRFRRRWCNHLRIRIRIRIRIQ